MKKIHFIYQLIAIITLFSCNPNNKETKIIIPKPLIPLSIPNIAFLDSLSNKNSDLLYNWDPESAKSEKNLSNKCDLAIKINRKVNFNFKNKKYILFPFFKKGLENSQILMLHFLLIENGENISNLKNISFDHLARIQMDKAYYFWSKK